MLRWLAYLMLTATFLPLAAQEKTGQTEKLDLAKFDAKIKPADRQHWS